MSLIALDFTCPDHGPFDRIVPRAIRKESQDCPTCNAPSPPVECYAVRGSVKAAEMMRGKSEPRPPHVLDTTPLAEGVPYETWAENESARLAKVLDSE
jgi:hypothetical protein